MSESDAADSAKDGESELTRVPFHYLKSTDFRVVHGDGVFGGATPQGLVFASFFSERFPLPQMTTQLVDDEGTLREAKGERVSREGVIRELEVGVMMTPKVARSVAKWLNDKAAFLEEQSAESPDATEGAGK